MRFLCSLLLCWCATATYLSAQTPCSSHPTDPNAVYIGTFTVDVKIPGCGDPLSLGDTHGCICVWLNSDSTLDFILDISSVVFPTPCGVMDSTTLGAALDMIALKAVQQGATLGYSPCDRFGRSDTTRVLTQACGDRSGSGGATSFDPCNNNWCARLFYVTCVPPNGETVNRYVEDNSSCSGADAGCESGCNGNSQGGGLN